MNRINACAKLVQCKILKINTVSIGFFKTSTRRHVEQEVKSAACMSCAVFLTDFYTTKNDSAKLK